MKIDSLVHYAHRAFVDDCNTSLQDESEENKNRETRGRDHQSASFWIILKLLSLELFLFNVFLQLITIVFFRLTSDNFLLYHSSS